MTEAFSVPALSAEQKELWKDLGASFEDPVAAVELFNSSGLLRKDFSFLMAFAALASRMDVVEIGLFVWSRARQTTSR